jgi:hypothetical protein
VAAVEHLKDKVYPPFRDISEHLTIFIVKTLPIRLD